MRAAQEPAISVDMVHLAVPGRHRYHLDLALPGVALVVVSHRDAPVPDAPDGLVLRHYRGIHGTNVVLSWLPAPSAGLQIFDVLWRATEDSPEEIINPAPLLSGVFLHPAAPVSGIYRVRARDAFGRTSAPSRPLTASH
jgi:L-iduronidase